MAESRPAWASEFGVDYSGIVKSWGYNTVVFETFGDYQGDHIALVGDGQRVGLVVIGYGSCSGCDELQAIEPYGDDEDDDWGPVIELADRLREQIHWEDSREQLGAYVDATEEAHWWSYDGAMARWLNAELGSHIKVDDD